MIALCSYCCFRALFTSSEYFIFKLLSRASISTEFPTNGDAISNQFRILLLKAECRCDSTKSIIVRYKLNDEQFYTHPARLLPKISEIARKITNLFFHSRVIKRRIRFFRCFGVYNHASLSITLIK